METSQRSPPSRLVLSGWTQEAGKSYNGSGRRRRCRRCVISRLSDVESCRMPKRSAHALPWQGWAALILLFLTFLTITYDHSKAWNNPNRGDQDLDLTLGLKIRHFEALSDGYHHPLLPALIAPFAEKTLTYFAKAKLVNVAIGALAFWVITWVGLGLVGPTPTFLALVAIAPGLSNKSAELTAEPLLLLLIVLTFYGLVRGFTRPSVWAYAGA